MATQRPAETNTPFEPMVMLPCPFCGESARLAVHRKKSGRKDGYQARCLSCFVGQTRSYYSELEVQMNAAGAKPSDFVRHQFQQQSIELRGWLLITLILIGLSFCGSAITVSLTR